MTTPFLRPPNAGTYNETWLAIMDQRVRAGQQTTQTMATVVATDPVALRLYVVVDGASLSTPVKLAGHVQAQPGDRVALTRYGADWVAMGNLSRIGGPNIGSVSVVGSAGTTSAASYSDLPGTPSFTFTKRWTNTGMLLFASMSCYTTQNDSYLQVALKFTEASSGAVTTYLMFKERWSTALERAVWSHCRPVAGGLAAGVYDVRPQWQRQAGTGVITENADDWVSAFAIESGV